MRLAVLAILCLLPGRLDAATLHWWRFENGPGFLADSVGGMSLAASGDTHALLLPATGRGSAFPEAFTPTGGNLNQRAAEFDGSGDFLSTTLTLGTETFTVECFVHLDSATASDPHPFVSYRAPSHPQGTVFLVHIRADGLVGSQPRELLFGGFAGASLPAVAVYALSGIILELGKDYYIGVSYRRTGPSEITFHVKNLTDGTPLQTVVKPHSGLELIAGSVFEIGGLPGIGTDGLIDEVRFSSDVLEPRELLVSQVGLPIPALPGPALLALAAALGAAALKRA